MSIDHVIIDLASLDGRRLVVLLAHARMGRRQRAGKLAKGGSAGPVQQSTLELTDDDGLSGNGLAAVEERARDRHAMYTEQVRLFRDLIGAALPAGSSISVISRGDNAFGSGVDAFRHFPSDVTGRWIGHHPSDSNDAIRYLDEAIDRGATHVGVPEPSRWWLDHYSDFASRLAGGSLVVDVEGVGVIWALAPSSSMSSGDGASVMDASGVSRSTTVASSVVDAQTGYDESVRELRCWADAILGSHRRVIVISRGDPELTSSRYDHFPVNAHGTYDGHPADDADALGRLCAAYERGAEFVLVPEAMSWWAETYPTFWAIVRSGCTVERPGSGWLCDLSRTALTTPTPAFDEEST